MSSAAENLTRSFHSCADISFKPAAKFFPAAASRRMPVFIAVILSDNDLTKRSHRTLHCVFNAGYRSTMSRKIASFPRRSTSANFSLEFSALADGNSPTNEFLRSLACKHLVGCGYRGNAGNRGYSRRLTIGKFDLRFDARRRDSCADANDINRQRIGNLRDRWPFDSQTYRKFIETYEAYEFRSDTGAAIDLTNSCPNR